MTNQESTTKIDKKTCCYCNKLKLFTDFNKDKRRSNGITSKCKSCLNNQRFIIGKTIDGFIELKYRKQLISSKKRNHLPPSYSLLELNKWVISQPNFKILWNNWINSNYNKKLSPSIDRINDYKPYSLCNIQLITWEQNYRKYHKDRESRKNTKTLKSVNQYDLKGNFIKNFISLIDAYKFTNIDASSICNSCKGKRKTAGGFIWRYSTQ